MTVVWISGSAPSRPTPSTTTTTPTTSRMTPLTSAARISARCQPKVHRSRAGRVASQVAASASPSAAVSESMCPASARRASEPESQPPTASATMTVAVTRNAASRRGRWATAAVWWCPCDTSGPAELVEPLVVDAEVVGDLVDDGDRHLLDDLLDALAHPQRGAAEDRDAVREGARRPPRVTLGEGRPLVESEEVRVAGALGGLVLDEDDDVVHLGGELRRHEVQAVTDGLLELRAGHLDHAPIIAHPSGARARTPATVPGTPGVG